MNWIVVDRLHPSSIAQHVFARRLKNTFQHNQREKHVIVLMCCAPSTPPVVRSYCFSWSSCDACCSVRWEQISFWLCACCVLWSLSKGHAEMMTLSLNFSSLISGAWLKAVELAGWNVFFEACRTVCCGYIIPICCILALWWWCSHMFATHTVV